MITRLQIAAGIVLVLAAFLVFAYWRGHSVGYNAGVVHVQAQMDALQAGYDKAIQAAADKARNAQARADADALAQAQAQAAAAQRAAQSAAGIAADANARVLAIQAKLNETAKHDSTLANWAAARRPAATVGLHVNAG